MSLNSFNIRILFSLVVLLMAACGSDDSADPVPDNNEVEPGTPGSVTCKIDGEAFSAVSPFNAAQVTFTDDFYAIAVTGIDFFDQDTVAVALAMSGINFSSLSAGAVFSGTGTVGLDFALGAVEVNRRPTTEIDARSDETEVAEFTITKIDRENQLISGTFSYRAVDPDTGSSFEVSDGIFTDMEYN